MQYYIGLPDLNSEPNIEIFLGSRVDKCETQLGICRGTAMFWLLLKLVLVAK